METNEFTKKMYAKNNGFLHLLINILMQIYNFFRTYKKNNSELWLVICDWWLVISD